MKKSIIWKFFGACAVSTFIAVFVLNFFVSLKLRDDVEEKISNRLKDNAMLVSRIITEDLVHKNASSIQQKVSSLGNQLGLRITVIDSDGKVLGDSQKKPDLMENHSDRLEIIEAIDTGFGTSTRFSNTLGYEMKYVAVRVYKDNESIGIVRFAIPLSEVRLQIRIIHRAVLFGGLAAIIITIIAAYFMAKYITSPIRKMKDVAEKLSKGDFSRKINIKSEDELGELAKSLNTMADELQQQIENLQRMDKIRTDFVANVSHELKTPLTSIKGFVETLEDGAIDNKETAQRFISIIKKHAQRLENIVNDLLSLSELETSKDTIEKTKFDLKELFDEIALGFGHALSLKDQKLTINAPGDDFEITADRDRIEEVFVNLIDNAIKYSDRNQVIKVILSVENGRVRATVEDTGTGIPKKHLDRVFERFYCVDKARSRELGGTGLGLGIAKHIVYAHKGEIGIESERGQGTKVSVILPKK